MKKIINQYVATLVHGCLTVTTIVLETEDGKLYTYSSAHPGRLVEIDGKDYKIVE